jgi:type IV pilus assembly protein PilP
MNLQPTRDARMKNYLARIRTLICLLGTTLLLASCADSDVAAAHPQVVRKKINAPAEALPQPSSVAAQPAPGPAAPAAEQTPPLVAAAKTPEVSAPVPRVDRPVAAVPSAPTVEPVRPVVAALPPAAAPEPQAKKIGAALAITDSQVAALLNLHAQAPYDAKGKADPFEALLRDESVAAAGGKLVPKKRDPQSPLEKIDLGQLKLVAIIAASSGNRALVEESSGKGYILREGTYVGLNSGKVVNISIDKVMVEEEFEDAYGKTITQKKEITLPKPPGEL